MEKEESGRWAAKGVTLLEVTPHGNKGGGKEAFPPGRPLGRFYWSTKLREMTGES